MNHLISDPKSGSNEHESLRRRLDEFYAATDEYTAFQQSNSRESLYDVVAECLGKINKTSAPPRVLELGCGRTNLPTSLKNRGIDVHFTAQDVTDYNRDYLEPIADDIHVGDIAELEPGYDLILSTYVFEHVSNPGEFLEHVDRILSPGGFHMLVCPRYDYFGYVCPSVRHLSKPKQLWHSAQLTLSRLKNNVLGRERFWVNTDPALFHTKKWFRDSDAIHLVSEAEVLRWHRRRGYAVSTFTLPRPGLKARALHRMMTMSMKAQKPT